MRRAARTTLLAFMLSFAGCSDEAPEVQTIDVAVLETSKGALVIAFYPESAPLAVENFKTHARDGYFDGTRFHRIIPGFIIQGGDPTGTGSGGESIWGEPFANEIDPDLGFVRRGMVGMANAGPNTNGSQFFITLRATPWLDGVHTVFGRVVGGMATVAAIESVGTQIGRPSEDVTIIHAYLRTRSVE